MKKHINQTDDANKSNARPPEHSAPAHAHVKAGKTDDACINDPSKDVICSKGVQGCTVDHSKPVDQAVLDDINAQYRDYNNDSHEEK